MTATQAPPAPLVTGPLYYRSFASYERPIRPLEMVAFLEQHVRADEPIRARALAALIRQHFDLTVHPRTIERAVRGKKTPP